MIKNSIVLICFLLFGLQSKSQASKVLWNSSIDSVSFNCYCVDENTPSSYLTLEHRSFDFEKVAYMGFRLNFGQSNLNKDWDLVRISHDSVFIRICSPDGFQIGSEHLFATFGKGFKEERQFLSGNLRTNWSQGIRRNRVRGTYRFHLKSLPSLAHSSFFYSIKIDNEFNIVELSYHYSKRDGRSVNYLCNETIPD